MSHKKLRPLKSLLAVFAAVLGLHQSSKAGPPLICHPFDIGDAKSLPWSSNAWNFSGKADYDLSRLVQDTLSLLSLDAPVIVRMETLRRAALYAGKNQAIASELLARLKARALEAEGKGGRNGLAWFDLGYLVETFKQANLDYKKLPSGAWQAFFKPNPAAGLDGYAWVLKAIALQGQSPEMEFAAALITSLDGPQKQYQTEHLRKAVTGAREGTLLARNLVLHFGDQAQTLAALRAQVAGSKN